jgi:ABC-type transporter Mla subunit MlaD
LEAIDDAIAAVADAKADAIAASAELEDELAPFVSRFETVATNNLSVVPVTADLAHRLAIAVNALNAEVALTKANPAEENSDGFDAAVGDVDDLLAEIIEFVDTEGDGGAMYDFDAADYNLDGDYDFGGSSDFDGVYDGTGPGDWELQDVENYIDNIEFILDNPIGTSEAGATGGLYTAIEDFFDGGDADGLASDIGHFSGQSYIDYVQDLADAGASVVDFDSMDESYATYSNDDYGWVTYDEANDDLYDALVDAGVYDGSEDGSTLAADAADASVDFTAAVADAQADYDAAEAAAAEADDAVSAIEDVREPFNDELETLNAELDALEPVETALENYIDGINADVEDFQDAVDDAQAAVDAAEYGITSLDSDVTKIGAQIVYEQARLADLQAELAAKQAEVAAWLALLNAALGN